MSLILLCTPPNVGQYSKLNSLYSTFSGPVGKFWSISGQRGRDYPVKGFTGTNQQKQAKGSHGLDTYGKVIGNLGSEQSNVSLLV